jgi:hypothetical protein
MGHIIFPSTLIILMYLVKTDILQKKTEALLVTSKEIGLRVNAGKPSISPCFISSMKEENTT